MFPLIYFLPWSNSLSTYVHIPIYWNGKWYCVLLLVGKIQLVVWCYKILLSRFCFECQKRFQKTEQCGISYRLLGSVYTDCTLITGWAWGYSGKGQDAVDWNRKLPVRMMFLAMCLSFLCCFCGACARSCRRNFSRYLLEKRTVFISWIFFLFSLFLFLQ